MGDTVDPLWQARAARAAAWLLRPPPKFGACWATGCWATGYWLRKPRPALRLRGMRRRHGRKHTS